jgi:hypothetical protein
MNELKTGQRVEEEHKKTYKFIERRIKQTGHIPSFKDVTKSIAKDHLKEDKDYYQKLKKCNL